MIQSTLILSFIAIILIFVNKKNTGKHLEGLKSGMKQMIHTTPIILGAFILGGMVEVLIPEEFVQNWLSQEAGLKGILLGTIGGMMLAMGPYAAFPLIASILSSGAGLGTVISAITSCNILGLNKAPYELAYYGFKFFIYKLIVSMPLCFMAGLLAHMLEVIVLSKLSF